MNMKSIILSFSSVVLVCMVFTSAVAIQKKNSDSKAMFFDKTSIDERFKPGDDFFLYANGNWIKKTAIPPTEVSWGSFNMLRYENQQKLRKILQEVSATPNSKGSIHQQVGDLYAGGMDTLAMDKLGYTPIEPLLASIDTLKNYKALIRWCADSFKEGESFLFAFSVDPDDKISTKNAVNCYQTGLGLPNRDYYFKEDSATQRIRTVYVQYITKLFTLIGTAPPIALEQANLVLRLETEIAASHFTPVELRDPIKNYYKFSVTEFKEQVPNLDIDEVLARMFLKTDTLIVKQPKYYTALNDLLKSKSIELWKSKLKFELINANASVLSKEFRVAYFEFYGKTLKGQKKPKERWEQMAETVNANLGELLGQLYVNRYFKPEAKQRMLTLVNNLQQVYKARIERLDWMSVETKQRAIAKLETFTKKIGYPDKWKRYVDVTIHRDSFYRSLQSIARHDYREMVDKLGKPVDKMEWFMTPSTVNAYYNPSFNEIVFPAGILQFPFFDFEADDAINYGAIGAVIGHEMTHGFDDQGRQYDKDGNLQDWWTADDAEKFNKKAQVVVDQYNQFSVLDNQHVNGSLTLGENIADIGGLTIAYEAFKKTTQGKNNQPIDGLTPDQRFFLSFAQVWRIKMSDEIMRMRLLSDPHSPPMFRVNGTLSNMPEFYKAFDIKPNDKMYRIESERVKIW